MQFIKPLRAMLSGKDFSWQLIPGKGIPTDKENVFGDVSVLISGTNTLTCVKCSKSSPKKVNFKMNQKMIRCDWQDSTDPFANSIKLKFEPAHSKLKIRGIGAQYAVDTNSSNFEFIALLRVTDNLGNSTESPSGLIVGKTVSEIDDSAIFLGVLADAPGLSIQTAEFAVQPKLVNTTVDGFYINNLRIFTGK